ncbi:hypothetical protein [Parasutterella muris]|uniref:Uncharacterized protein n=1 Tax=Parasutterella muris TaxID=2565572 RepID=A0A6L6YGR7_9BURK|nr:hypothetical protein [Parasutterella muris]MVX56767.1 hypothetical protein [Parasutterella muris]
MQTSQFTTFIFFSEAQAIAFSEAARTLLTWAGANYPETFFRLAREYIARIESADHKIPLEDAQDLLALLGTCCMTTQHDQPTRTLWHDCVRILSKKINDIPE